MRNLNISRAIIGPEAITTPLLKLQTDTNLRCKTDTNYLNNDKQFTFNRKIEKQMENAESFSEKLIALVNECEKSINQINQDQDLSSMGRDKQRTAIIQKTISAVEAVFAKKDFIGLKDSISASMTLPNWSYERNENIEFKMISAMRSQLRKMEFPAIHRLYRNNCESLENLLVCRAIEDKNQNLMDLAKPLPLIPENLIAEGKSTRLQVANPNLHLELQCVEIFEEGAETIKTRCLRELDSNLTA